MKKCLVFLSVVSIFLGLVACGGGGGDGSAQQTISKSLAIVDVEPSAALAGDEIVVTYEGDVEPEIVYGGSTIESQPVIGSPNSLSFIVPVGAESGPLYLQSGELVSNNIWFSISSASVATPSPDEVVLDSNGNMVAVNQLMVSLHEEFDSLVEAERIAAMIGGNVIGQIPLIDGYQIKVDSTSLTELEVYIATVEADPAVDFVMMNTLLPEDAIDWTADPDTSSQRDSNQVEQGAEVYVANVHPTGAGKIRPVFTAVGVVERNVDYDEPDFSGYDENGLGRSNNIALYAKDGDVDEADHGTVVSGVLAGELGDGGMAGLLQAISGAHGGFNIVVDKPGGWVFSAFASTERFLEEGAKVINWSFGIHKEGAIKNTGDEVDNNVRAPIYFTPFHKAATKLIRKVETDYPSALIISTAGNGQTNAGDENFRSPSSIVSENLLVVGAHLPSSTPSRAWYSNYGERVDISASGTVNGYDDTDHQGTSYAAPLVTATVAAIQSIDPDITPSEIRTLLRTSALPIENNVPVTDGSDDVVTSPLSLTEVGEDTTRLGKGARLNVKGAIQAAVDRRGTKTVPVAPSLEVELEFGLSSDVIKTVDVTLPDGSIYDKVDILFLVDVSGSYSDDLSQFQAQANDLINAFKAGGANVEIGLASFSDFPLSPYGDEGIDYAYRLDQPLTNDSDNVITAINALAIKSGSDGPESQLEALYQAATGLGRTVEGTPDAEISPANVGWREGALPVIFLATDAAFHDSGNEPAYPGASWDEARTALNAKKIRVYGLQSGGSITDVSTIVTETGGAEFTLSSNSAEVVAAVESALTDASTGVKVALKKTGDFADLVKEIDPEFYEDVYPGETLTFDVTFSRATFKDDVGEHVFSFRLDVEAEDVAIIQEIPVTVTVK